MTKGSGSGRLSCFLVYNLSCGVYPTCNVFKRQGPPAGSGWLRPCVAKSREGAAKPPLRMRAIESGQLAQLCWYGIDLL